MANEMIKGHVTTTALTVKWKNNQSDHSPLVTISHPESDKLLKHLC